METVRVIREGREQTYQLIEEQTDGALLLRPEPQDGAGPIATAAAPAAPIEAAADTLAQIAAGADRHAPSVSDRATEAVLEVDDLTVAYGPKVAVANVSFDIKRGEIFGLLGPNGAGKTSTLSVIEGLIKPRSGTVLVDGLDIRRHAIQAKSRMGVQLQATSFQADLTIRQIIRLYAGLYGVDLSPDQVTARLNEVGLQAEADKPFSQLSGGQQQRLALQIAVIHEPVLLLLDEPTSGLDPQSRRQLWGRIEQLRQRGGSIVLTTHSMEEAQAVCDRVAIIDHGTLLTAETPRGLIAKHRSDPRVLAVAHGDVTLEDVFIGLTGSEIRD